MECTEEAIDFKVGETYHTYQVPSGFYKIHIVAIVDEYYVVFKWYGRHKQWWHYEVKPSLYLTWDIDKANKIREEQNA